MINLKTLPSYGNGKSLTAQNDQPFWAFQTVDVPLECTSNRLTPIPVAANLKSDVMPFDFICDKIVAYLVTPSSSGIFTIDVKKNGVSVFSTLLTIDAGEQNSLTAAIPAVLGINSWTEGNERTVAITNNGGGDASGLILHFVGRVIPASLAGADLVAPSDVTGLTANAVSSSQINLTWDAATDNVGISAYNLQRATNSGFTTGVTNIPLGNVTSYPDNNGGAGLSPSTAYYYRIKAIDIAGNPSSNYSTPATDTTNVANDTDAQAYLDAIANTDGVTESAVNQLFLDLKAASIYTKIKAFYLFRGGTEAKHKFNAKNPVNTDGAYRLTFSGPWIHDANGITGSEVDQPYADTHLNPSTDLSDNNTHLAFYSRSNTIFNVEIGVIDASANHLLFGSKSTFGGDALLADSYSNTDRLNISNADGRGFYVASRTSSTSFKVYKNGSQIGSTYTTAETSGLPNVNLWIGGVNDNGSANFSSNKNLIFVSIGDGFSDSEAAALSTAVNAFATALGLNV